MDHRRGFWRYANRVRRTVGTIIATICSVSLFWTVCSRLATSGGTSPSSAGTQPGPDNSTFGFGAIYVLSDDATTWRTRGLLQAAKEIGGLQLIMEYQKRPEDGEVLAFIAGDEMEESFDSIRAVMSYLSLLDSFLKSDHDTALFVEDDVDFDLSIKSQLRDFSDAIQSSNSGHISASDPYRKDSWDVLWLGHCGLKATASTHNISYDDTHALPWDRLRCPLDECFKKLREEQSPPQISSNVAPMCTYAYALTREHAGTILDRMRKERCQSFDMCMYHHCKEGKQRCTAPMPELFHHHKVIGQKHLSGPHTKTADEKQDLDWWRGKHKYTYNIQWSARCNAGQVGEKLEAGWQCLPGRYDDVW